MRNYLNLKQYQIDLLFSKSNLGLVRYQLTSEKVKGTK